MLTGETLAVNGQSAPPPGDGVWVSLTDLAKAKGFSKANASKTVARYVAEGIVSTRKRGRELLVNLVEFDRARGENVDPAQALRNARPADDEDDAGAEAPAPRDGSYRRAREAREGYLAEDARLNLEERVGNLVDRTEVDRRTFGILRRTRDRFLSMGSRLSDRLAAAPDARAVKALLDAEVRAVLTQLAADFERADDEADIDDGGIAGAPD